MQHRPSEIFGYPPESSRGDALRNRREYRCPFLGQTCTKKSTHYLLEGKKIPFGVCSVWHVGRTASESIPHIICPTRFRQDDVIFQSVSDVLDPVRQLIRLQEVKILELGTVDWFVVDYDPQKSQILNFYGLETMAVSTTMTGQIVRAMLDSFQGRLQDKYGYGINYRQVLSRMIVQLLEKGRAFHSWRKKVVWVIQDVLYDYMTGAYSLTLNDGLNEPIGLSIFSLTRDERLGQFVLRHLYDKSGTFEDFTGMLVPQTSQIPSEDRVKEILSQKITGRSARPFLE